MGKRGLPAKQKRFVMEYLVDLNATQAAIRAGYSAKTATVQGPRLLGKVRIQQEIEKGQKKIAERAGITIDELINGYKEIAFSDIAQCYNEDGSLKNIHEIPKQIRMAIAGMEIEELFEKKGKDKVHVGYIKKIKLWDKTKSLDALGRHLGFFNADTSQKPESQPIINLTLTKIDVKPD